MGEGGFSKVFRIKRISDDKEFALKFLQPKDKKEKDRILNEIGLHAISEHDSIVNFHEAYDYQNRSWIIMEIMQGGNLTAMIDEHAG